MGQEQDDPLESLYDDKSRLDRERLASALENLIGIDDESGEPIFKEGYHDFTGPKQFVTLLLYRRAAVALGEISEDEVGISAEEAGRLTSVSASTIRNYSGDLGFIQSDRSKGGYYLSAYGVEQAIDFIEDDDD